jgi:hypothetical protein
MTMTMPRAASTPEGDGRLLQREFPADIQRHVDWFPPVRNHENSGQQAEAAAFQHSASTFVASGI